MMPFKKCPICGGEVVKKEVEKLLRGGENIATIQVAAEVCLHCGERLYDEDTIRRFEDIRRKLERQQTAEFQLMGHSFKVE
jgi:YgiT-type zinc finger domain-containing protein